MSEALGDVYTSTMPKASTREEIESIDEDEKGSKKKKLNNKNYVMSNTAPVKSTSSLTGTRSKDRISTFAKNEYLASIREKNLNRLKKLDKFKFQSLYDFSSDEERAKDPYLQPQNKMVSIDETFHEKKNRIVIFEEPRDRVKKSKLIVVANNSSTLSATKKYFSQHTNISKFRNNSKNKSDYKRSVLGKIDNNIVNKKLNRNLYLQYGCNVNKEFPKAEEPEEIESVPIKKKSIIIKKQKTTKIDLTYESDIREKKRRKIKKSSEPQPFFIPATPLNTTPTTIIIPASIPNDATIKIIKKDPLIVIPDSQPLGKQVKTPEQTVNTTRSQEILVEATPTPPAKDTSHLPNEK